MNTYTNGFRSTAVLWRVSPLLMACSFLLATNPLAAATLDISDAPLSVNLTAPPLTMIVLGRDHKLYYEAYNDASDVNGDGTIDTHYNPEIDYFGYFDSYKCYQYASGRFDPVSVTSDKTCSGLWSGDFLNYLTTSRMDALRKVLYGGYRLTDTENLTILERSNIPQDAHSWGKEYTSVAVDGYNISRYAPLALPASNRRHLFANTTLLNGTGEPLLRVAPNQPYRVWEWLSIERPVAGSRVQNGGTGPDISASITNYIVRVKVCDQGVGLETNCQVYANGEFKPTGLLQTFGENKSMQFGLMTGSYGKNKSGGVLRKNIENITDEVNINTGILTSTVGIIRTIDRLRVIGFGGNYEHQANCGFIFTRDFNEGECRLWGNPLAEMMYETVRYFAGKTSPTSAFTATGGDDSALGLPAPAWVNPYKNESNQCARPNMLVVSDIYPSYDSDQIPGSAFGGFSGDLSPAMDASALGQTIWNGETGGASKVHFIGQSGTVSDGAPTPKTVTSFGNIRGLSPEEPNKQGSYYAASVAYYGWLNDVNAVEDEQKIFTYAVALASPLPKILIPIGGKFISLVPFAKSVGGVGSCDDISPKKGDFQPTNTLVDFYIEELTPTSGVFRINFEDAQQGADHDMDAIVRYEYVLNSDNTVTITLTSNYAAGCIIQHMGYIISGTTADGIYLEVRDQDTSSNNDIDYFLDTPPGKKPNEAWQDNQALPLTASRTFTPSNAPAATLLNDPLWYAAKWGSFNDSNNNNIPDIATEYDADNNDVPDNYFLVTNALRLQEQLKKAFDQIAKRGSSTAAVAFNSASLQSTARLYQVIANSTDWSGQILAFSFNTTTGELNTNGPGPQGSLWDAGQLLNSKNHLSGREILTWNPSSNAGIPFTYNRLTNDQQNALRIHPDSGVRQNNTVGQQRLNYLRGDRSREQANGGAFRDRLTLLGDVIHSAPLYVGAPDIPYRDLWSDNGPENSKKYSLFKTDNANRTPMLYVGANDGIMHAFDANTGEEKLAFIPNRLFDNLNLLTSPRYEHRFYVDGAPNSHDVFFSSDWHTVLAAGLNAGGQAVFALDITDPGNFNENNANSLVLWEFSDLQDRDLGYTYSQPALVRLANGQWAAVFGNGYNNTVADGQTSITGNAVLYIVDVSTGALIRKFDTFVGMSKDPLAQARPNGLATPAVVDVNGDFIADYVYVGDLFGNLWKIDIRSTNPGNWGFSFTSAGLPAPLFVARDSNNRAQPITSRPNVTRAKTGSTDQLIFFGTGKYIEISDKSDTHVQTFYALFDDQTTAISGRSALLQQTILSEVTLTAGGETSTYRITSDNALTAGQRGWYIDLVLGTTREGERVVSNPIVGRNNKVIFSTLIPSTKACGFGGTGWIMELDMYDGGRLDYTPFDLNRDNRFTSDDLRTFTSGGLTQTVAVSGVKSTVGIIPTPGIITAGNNAEYKYAPGSSGRIQVTAENPGQFAAGRQSWRQLK